MNIKRKIFATIVELHCAAAHLHLHFGAPLIAPILRLWVSKQHAEDLAADILQTEHQLADAQTKLFLETDNKIEAFIEAAQMQRRVMRSVGQQISQACMGQNMIFDNSGKEIREGTPFVWQNAYGFQGITVEASCRKLLFNGELSDVAVEIRASDSGQKLAEQINAELLGMRMRPAKWADEPFGPTIDSSGARGGMIFMCGECFMLDVLLGNISVS